MNKNQHYQEEQRIQTAAGSSTARNVCYQTPSQSSAVSIPHFLEQKQFSNFFQAVLKATKGFKPKVSFTAGCPQWKTCFSGRQVGSLREWGATILSLVIRTLNSAHGRYFLFPIHCLPQYMLAQFLLLRCWAASPWEIWRDILNLSQPIWVWANLEPKLNGTLISVYLLRDLYSARTH